MPLLCSLEYTKLDTSTLKKCTEQQQKLYLLTNTKREKKTENEKSELKKNRKVYVIHLEVTPLFVYTTKGISTTHTSSLDLVFSFSLHKSSNLIDPVSYFGFFLSVFFPYKFNAPQNCMLNFPTIANK